MRRAIVSGLMYTRIVFVIGFALGVVRTLFVASRTGDVMAVALELPLMLAASWAVCRRLTRRVPLRPATRLVMGGTAFCALLAIEFGFAVLLFGRPPSAWLAAFATPAGWLGLAGQIGFGLIPILVGRTLAGCPLRATRRGCCPVAALQHRPASASRRRVR